MKLVDMKRTKAEKKAASEPCKATDIGDEYPYGLTLHLSNEQLKKLGIDSLPKVGKTMTLQAKCKVIAVRSNESTRGDDRSLELQMQKMGLSTDAGSMAEALGDAIDG